MPMAIEFRAVDPDDFLPWARGAALAFSYSVPDEVHEITRASFDFSRTVGGYEGARVVATGANLGLRMAVPGGALPVGAVTAITVHPTHRRKGLLRELMGWIQDDSRSRGEAISVLRASEASIYGRFGYGMATWRAEYEIDRRDLVVVPRSAPGGIGRIGRIGRIELGRAVDLVPTLKQLWGRYWSSQPGELDRSEGWWTHRFADHESQRGGGSERMAAIHHGADGPDGYATYRTYPGWGPGGLPNHTVHVDALVAIDGAARMTLFGYLAGLDLAARVELWDFPAGGTAPPSAVRPSPPADHRADRRSVGVSARRGCGIGGPPLRHIGTAGARGPRPGPVCARRWAGRRSLLAYHRVRRSDPRAGPARGAVPGGKVGADPAQRRGSR